MQQMAALGRLQIPGNEVEIAVGDWLRMQETHFNLNGNFKLPRWDK
jgi:hypothetical protein